MEISTLPSRNETAKSTRYCNCSNNSNNNIITLSNNSNSILNSNNSSLRVLKSQLA